MDRRGFFRLFGAGVAGIALEQAIPLGRVWSFPSKIVVPEFSAPTAEGLAITWLSPKMLEFLRRDLRIEEAFEYPRMKIGSTMKIRMPQRFIIREILPLKPVTSEIVNLRQLAGFDLEIEYVTPAFPPAPRRSPS